MPEIDNILKCVWKIVLDVFVLSVSVEVVVLVVLSKVSRHGDVAREVNWTVHLKITPDF